MKLIDISAAMIIPAVQKSVPVGLEVSFTIKLTAISADSLQYVELEFLLIEIH
jgi:hypothetical protein